ncbi:MAG: twin-arginine translocase TatA/TatE family subunit [Kiritimatiellaceae bacterium]|nr:twin-arginine translocase TatA/TatE family subunit [Kiritimatiellaceae bacterium]
MVNFSLAFMAISGGELMVVLLAILLLFGAKDAPRILRTLQSGFDKLQRAAADFRYAILSQDVSRPPPRSETPSTSLPEHRVESEPPSTSHEKPVS